MDDLISNQARNGLITFLRTVIDVSDDVNPPFYLDENHRFAKTPAELRTVHHKLCERRTFSHINPYENEWVKNPHTNENGFISKSLSEIGYRYFAIQTVNNHYEIESHYLAQVLALHLYPLHFPSHASTRKLWGEGESFSQSSAIEMPSHFDKSIDLMPILTLNDLEFAKSLWEKYKKFSENQEITLLFTKFTSLLRLHEQCLLTSCLSPLKIIAEFATLEGALTHKPKEHIITDSLTHQICKKLTLLSTRPNVQMPTVKGEQLDKTWKRLYALRSKIVHGESDSSWIDLKLQQAELINCLHHSDFIAATVRAVLRAILFEPELVFSLKDV